MSDKLHHLMEKLGIHSHKEADDNPSASSTSNYSQGQPMYGYHPQEQYTPPPQQGYTTPPLHPYYNNSPNGASEGYPPYRVPQGGPNGVQYGGVVTTGPDLPPPAYNSLGAHQENGSDYNKQQFSGASSQNHTPPFPPSPNAYPGYYTAPLAPGQQPQFASNNPFGPHSQAAPAAPTTPAPPQTKMQQLGDFLKSDNAKYGAGGLAVGTVVGAGATAFIAHQKHKKERKEWANEKDRWESQKQDFLGERRRMQDEINRLKAQRQSQSSPSSSSYYGVSGMIHGGSGYGMGGGMGGFGHNSSLDARIAALEMENRRNEMYMVQQARENQMDMMMFQQEMEFQQEIIFMDTLEIDAELAHTDYVYGDNSPEYVDNSTTVVNNTYIDEDNSGADNAGNDNNSESSDDEDREEDENREEDDYQPEQDEDQYSNFDQEEYNNDQDYGNFDQDDCGSSDMGFDGGDCGGDW